MFRHRNAENISTRAAVLVSEALLSAVSAQNLAGESPLAVAAAPLLGPVVGFQSEHLLLRRAHHRRAFPLRRLSGHLKTWSTAKATHSRTIERNCPETRDSVEVTRSRRSRSTRRFHRTSWQERIKLSSDFNIATAGTIDRCVVSII